MVESNYFLIPLLVFAVIILIRVFIIKKEIKIIDSSDEMEKLRRCEICGKVGKKEMMAKVQRVNSRGAGESYHRVSTMVYIHDRCRPKTRYDRRHGGDRRRNDEVI